MKKRISSLIFVCTFFILSFGISFPQPTELKYVNDYVGILSETTKSKIVSIGYELEQKTSAQVVVVVINSTDGVDIETYSNQLFRTWGIGQKDKNNGVLLLVAIKDRALRIEVGYGFEGAIPDGKAGRIRDQYIIPAFRNEDYETGIYQGYLALVKEVAKEYGVALSEENQKEITRIDESFNEEVVELVLFIVFIIVIILISLMNRRIGPRYPGGFGGFRGPGGFGGFGGSRGSRSSGGFGGFGGGSSGGGGASGKW